MNRQDPKLIRDILPLLVRESGWQEGLERADILDAWDRVVEERIRLATVRKYVRDGVLYCHLSSSALRSMAHFSREYYRDAINRRLGGQRVKKIVLR